MTVLRCESRCRFLVLVGKNLSGIKKRTYESPDMIVRYSVSPLGWCCLAAPYLVVIKAYYRASWADLSASCFPLFLVPESDVCESVSDK